MFVKRMDLGSNTGRVEQIARRDKIQEGERAENQMHNTTNSELPTLSLVVERQRLSRPFCIVRNVERRLQN